MKNIQTLFNGEAKEEKFIYKKSNYIRHEKLIKYGWKKQTRLMELRGRKFFNGKLLRFENIIVNGKLIKIEFSKSIDYRDVIGLRYNSFNLYKYKKTPDALSVFCFVITKDNKLVIVERDSGDSSKCYEIPGGFLRENETILKGGENRLKDNLQLENKNIIYTNLIVIYKHKKICEVPSIVLFKINLNSSEIKQKEIYFLENDFENLKQVKNIFKPFHIPSKIAINQYIKYLKIKS